MIRRYAASLLAMVVAACVAICHEGLDNQALDNQANDKKLVAAVKAASEKGIEADKVDEAVGSRAILNTFRKEDQRPFAVAKIVADPDRKPALPSREALRYAAYWIRPVDSRNPKLVGIYWPKEGKPQMFFGEILPP